MSYLSVPPIEAFAIGMTDISARMSRRMDEA
jgi:hypothetical protein